MHFLFPISLVWRFSRVAKISTSSFPTILCSLLHVVLHIIRRLIGIENMKKMSRVNIIIRMYLNISTYRSARACAVINF
jgi:hypothetical protein